MDEVEVKIQAELDRTEIVQAEESGDGNERIDRSESQPKVSPARYVLAEPGCKSNHSTHQMEKIVGQRKREIKHFVAEKSRDADHAPRCRIGGARPMKSS